MGLWMLVTFGLMIFAIPIWSIVINGARQDYEKAAQDKLYVDLTDNVMGVTDWMLAGRSQEFLQLHVDSREKLLDVHQRMKKFERFRNFLMQMLFLLIVISLIIWGAAKFGGQQSLLTNWIAAFVLAAFPLNEALAGLPTAAQETNVYQKSLVRLNNLPDPDQKVKEKALSIAAPYNLTIQNIHYTYLHTKKEILRGINLNIHAGEKIAILGKSGAGKSTLAALLRGDRKPTEGQIDLNGIDVTKFGDQMPKYFSVINQKPYLFNTTIANNLRLGNKEASDDQLWDVLDRVGLKKTIEALPEKLETQVEEAGLRFSGGERHRLSLARILLKNTPIVLLDEPTVGLDPITEQAVIETFMKQLNGKTLIWITHHLQGIEKMNQVIFIEDGQIAMQGTPEQLWQNSRYRELKKADQGL
jgi:ATP-binding cassette subfamily C protein CydC